MKKFYCFAILLALSLGANAQFVAKKTLFTDSGFFVPKQFSYNGNTHIIGIVEEGDDWDIEYTFEAYNPDFEVERSFRVNFPDYNLSYETQSRKLKVTNIYVDRREIITIYDEQSSTSRPWTGTWEEAKSWVASNFPSEFKAIEGSCRFLPVDEREYFNYYTYGDLYPIRYIKWNSEGTISFIFPDYEEAPVGEWESIGSGSENPYDLIEYLSFVDLDDNSYPSPRFFFTQTLFNSDEKYEYLLAAFEGGDEIEEFDTNGDGINDYRRIMHGKRKGYNVVSEDGTILYKIDFEIENIIRVGGKIYLVSLAEEDDDLITFWSIDDDPDAVTQVKSISTFPKQIFSTDGRKLPDVRRGINIVRDTDGSVKKKLFK